jgi:hypothetical protein
MPKFFPVVDLDETLLTSAKYTRHLGYTMHLDDMTIKLGGKLRAYQAINLSPMKKIFRAFLSSGKPIVLLTKSKYAREDILPILEIMYGLDKGALDRCVYINKTHEYGDENMSKGEIIAMAIAKGVLPDNLTPVLIDNDEVQIQSAKDKGYGAIQVLAIPPEGKEVDNAYIWEIIELFGLKVSLDIRDYSLPNTKFRMCY